MVVFQFPKPFQHLALRVESLVFKWPMMTMVATLLSVMMTTELIYTARMGQARPWYGKDAK